MEPVKYIKEMLKIQDGTIVDEAVDMGLSTIPFLGDAIQNYRLSKLEKRINLNIKQMEIIKDKVESSRNEVFYKSEVFPLIMKQIMDEDEDEKVKVVIDGFEHIVDEDFEEMELIYHYYDVLAELRYNDIVKFIKKYMPYECRENLTLDIDLEKFEDLSREEQDLQKEKDAIEKYQENKFLRLGLLKDLIFSPNEEGVISLNANRTYDSSVEISEFGKRFVIFFALRD